jgi:AraC-like DNA-binding protein
MNPVKMGTGTLGPHEYLRGCAQDTPDMREQWLAFIDRHILRYRLGSAYLREREFSIEAPGRSVGQWAVCRVATWAGKCQLVRRKEDINADPRDRYMTYLSLRDEIEFEQFGHTLKAQQASLTMVSGADPLVHRKLGDNDTLCFGMPSGFVDQRIPRAENICAIPISVQGGLGSLVRHSLMSLYNDSAQMSDAEFLSASQILGELVLLSLASRADASTSTSFIRTSNLARAKRIVRARLNDPELTPAEIANECGISLSYLHNLFRDDGRSVCEYLLMERLYKARLMLQCGGGSTVTDIAMACGFSNLSSFSTAFRAAFSVTPREVLRSASTLP